MYIHNMCIQDFFFYFGGVNRSDIVYINYVVKCVCFKLIALFMTTAQKFAINSLPLTYFTSQCGM